MENRKRNMKKEESNMLSKQGCKKKKNYKTK